MALRDLLAQETDDTARAAQAAALGQSITGLSGHRTEAEERFGGREQVFGTPVEPLIGARVSPRGVESEQATEDEALLAHQRAAQAAGRERKPFGAHEQTLAYPNRPGFRRYWFNDIPGRIERAQEAGYTHVLDAGTGRPVGRITDQANGRGRSSYLMEIPIEWYQEDMARQAAELDKRLNDIRDGRSEPQAAENRYVPQQGIKIVRA